MRATSPAFFGLWAIVCAQFAPQSLVRKLSLSPRAPATTPAVEVVPYSTAIGPCKPPCDECLLAPPQAPISFALLWTPYLCGVFGRWNRRMSIRGHIQHSAMWNVDAELGYKAPIADPRSAREQPAEERDFVSAAAASGGSSYRYHSKRSTVLSC
jgi:hypothetical protein